jgi:hypothetical protein
MGKRKRKPIGKNTLDPAFQDRWKTNKPYRGYDCQGLRLGLFSLLSQRLWV